MIRPALILMILFFFRFHGNSVHELFVKSNSDQDADGEIWLRLVAKTSMSFQQSNEYSHYMS